ncbi:MAG TPA: hypothetical protein VNZ22_12925 [Bacillota bacterium]|nr:hypothetical protein [Bacillota bacterium]
MNATVVIERELRGKSRRPANYWLRVLSGGAFIALFAGIALTTQVLTRPFLGRALFLELHRILALAWMATWLLAFFCRR